MARAALGLGVLELAKLAQVSTNTVVRFERGESLKQSTIDHLRFVFETAGVEFIPANGGGPGVRLRQ
jgi:transcriptional regulator with XRE-family HTH domain